MSNAIDPVRARERRAVMAGTLVVLGALLLTKVLLPQWRTWQSREVRLAQTTTRVAQLRGLIQATRQLEGAAAAAEAALAGAPRRVLHATSSTLAAGALQSLLQGAVDGAGMVVNRVEVASERDSTGGLQGTVSAYGDIHGVSTLLHTLSNGPRAVTIERLSVQQNSALRGAPDVLQIQLTVHAPVLLDAPGSTALPRSTGAAEVPR